MSKKNKRVGIIASAVLGAGLAVAATAGAIVANQPVDVTYYANNGTPAVSAQIKKGDNTSLPTPTREGYNFAGWYLDTNLTQQVTSTAKLKKNSKLYAGWELANYELASTSAIDVKAQTAGLKSIGKYAFANSQITTITIPDTVTTIGEGAFQNCYNLQTVNLGSGLKSINKRAFQACNNLQTVSWNDDLEIIGNYAFDCTNLASITFPNSVKTIGESAFSSCSNLHSVTLGTSIETISSTAFDGCYGLTTINFADGLKSIPDYAFANILSLQTVNFGDGLKSIGEGVFQGCVNLQAVNLGDGLETIGAYAFDGTSLASITIPDSITTLGNYAFSNCGNLETITLGDGIKTLDASVFSGCGQIRTIDFGDGIISIDSHAFENHMLLQTVTFGNSLETIGDYAFNGIMSLQTVTFGNSLETIGESAFRNCMNLTTINLPESLTSVGELAFSGCGLLYFTEFTVSQSTFDIGLNAFDSCTVENLYIEDDIYNSIDNSLVLGGMLNGTNNVYVKEEIENAYYNSYFLEGITFFYCGYGYGDYSDYICFSVTGVETPFTITYYGYDAFFDDFGVIETELVRYRGTANWYEAEGIIGWSTTPDGDPEEISLTDIRESLELYACYEVFTVYYYNEDGSSLLDSEQVLYGRDALGTSYTDPYIIGWSTIPGGNPEYIDLTNIKEEMYLYACYETGLTPSPWD